MHHMDYRLVYNNTWILLSVGPSLFIKEVRKNPQKAMNASYFHEKVMLRNILLQIPQPANVACATSASPSVERKKKR